MEPSQILGRNIQKARRVQHWTQHQLAFYLGVSRATVSRWETGRSFPNIPALCVRLRVMPSRLFHGVDYRRPDTTRFPDRPRNYVTPNPPSPVPPVTDEQRAFADAIVAGRGLEYEAARARHPDRCACGAPYVGGECTDGCDGTGSGTIAGPR